MKRETIERIGLVALAMICTGAAIFGGDIWARIWGLPTSEDAARASERNSLELAASDMEDRGILVWRGDDAYFLGRRCPHTCEQEVAGYRFGVTLRPGDFAACRDRHGVSGEWREGCRSGAAPQH